MAEAPSVSISISGSDATYMSSSRSSRDTPEAFQRNHAARSRQVTHRQSRLTEAYETGSDSEASVVFSPIEGYRQSRRPEQRSPRRARNKESSRYRKPYVRDTKTSGESDREIASSRSPSSERQVSRGRRDLYSDEESINPSELTANDYIRKKVSFGPDQIRMMSRDSFTTMTDDQSSVRSRVGKKKNDSHQERRREAEYEYGPYGDLGLKYGY